MRWNYRIVRYADGRGFGLHEVYYGDEGSPQTMTATPACFAADRDEGPEAILRDLRAAIEDAAQHEVLDERAIPAQKETPPGLESPWRGRPEGS